MTQKPMSVAFVGTGDTTEANVKALLDDWMSEDKEYNPPIIPTVVKRAHKGLMRCRDWLSAEFEDSIDKLDLDEIVPDLVRARDDEDDPASPYLIYVPGEDDPHLEIVKAAIAEGIAVLDITQGLDQFNLAEEPEPEPEKPARRTRGRARTTEGEQPTLDDPPFDPPYTTDGGSESASKASAPSDVQTPTEGAASPAAASVATPGAIAAGGMQVVLSQATVEAVLNAFALMAADIKASVVAELPAAKPAKPKTYPYYVDEDGNYRPREGRGRPKKGERPVDLTAGEVAQLGLDGHL